MEQKSESVKVAVRIRPINKNEQSENATDIISTSENSVTIRDPTTGLTKNFGFDYIFNKESSNEVIYNAVGKDIVQYAQNGYNCCILAYGQTGSGKTYTMLNYKPGKTNLTEFGLIPHIANELLSTPTGLNEYQIEVSFVEIYAEKIFDLLSDDTEKTSLKIHINPKIGTYIEGLKSIAVSSIDQIMKLIEKGFKHRSTTATAMNEQSSRSHAIFNIDFKQICYSPILIDGQRKIISEKASKIKLVDLAGSERVKTSKVSGVNFQEAIAINKSLSMLSTVINELVETGSSTKFRNSMLTALLADSISGNSKTIIIANVSPASIQYDISMQTLFYVHRTKKIAVHAKVNETIAHSSQALVNELKAEIERLKSELLKITDPEEVTKLKEEIAEYERLYAENSRSWSDKLKDSEKSIIRLEHELTQRNSIINEHETNILLLTVSKNSLLEEKTILIEEKKLIELEIQSKHKELQTLLKSFNNEKDTLSNEIHDMQNEKTRLMQDKVILTNEKMTLLHEKVELTNNIHELIAEREQLIQTLHDMHHNIESLKTEKQTHLDRMSRVNLLFKPKS